MAKKRILLVDDEKSFTNLLKLNLEETGAYEVRVGRQRRGADQERPAVEGHAHRLFDRGRAARSGRGARRHHLRLSLPGQAGQRGKSHRDDRKVRAHLSIAAWAFAIKGQSARASLPSVPPAWRPPFFKGAGGHEGYEAPSLAAGCLRERRFSAAFQGF